MNSVFLQLFIEFFQIGLFAVGGGPATIPFLMDIPSRHDWYAKSDVVNMLAISESTPGPIGINMATYLGYEFYGIPGAIITSIGEVLPSIITILIIARIIIKFRENKCVQNIFSYLRPAGSGMVLVICVQMLMNVLIYVPQDLRVLYTTAGWKEFFNWMNISGYCLFFWLRHRFKWHPFFVVICGAPGGQGAQHFHQLLWNQLEFLV